jgi:uncharacterized protein (TIGR03437 family)
VFSLRLTVLLVLVGVFAGTLPADDRSYVLKTVAGTDAVGDSGLATSALLYGCEGVAVDRTGAIYISDSAGHRVRRVRPDGIIETVAGDGRPGFSGDGGAASRAQLSFPYGIAVDSAGSLYIADLGNARIRKVTAEGLITTVAGGSDGGTLRLQQPRNVAVDAQGGVYISDFGAHRVYRLAPGGGLEIIAGTGDAGFGGDGGPAVSAALKNPAGVALGIRGELYIADSGNKRIRVVTRGQIETVGVDGMPAYVYPIPLYGPTGVAVMANGGLLVSDGVQTLRLNPPGGGVTNLKIASRDAAPDLAGNAVVVSGVAAMRVTAAGTTLVAGGRTGVADGGAATATPLRRPSAVALDTSGNLYIAETQAHRVRKVAPDGTVTTIAGTGERGFSGDGGTAVSAKLDSPAGIAVGALGDIFIADTANHRVRKITGGIITTYAGTETAGFAGDDGPAVHAQLGSPSGLAADANGNLYVADTANHKVRVIQPSGNIQTLAGSGTAAFSGDGGPAHAAALNEPSGVAVGDDGSVLIADRMNGRVRVVRAGVIETLLNGLAAPRAVLVSDGRILVAGDAYVFDSKTPIAGTGTKGFNGEEGAASQTMLNEPAGLCAASDGVVYIADAGNHRVRRLELTSIAAPIVEPPKAEPPASVAVVHAATKRTDLFAANQLVAITGLPGSGVAFTFDGLEAPALYDNKQYFVQIPAWIHGRASTRLAILEGGRARNEMTLRLAEAAVGVFTIAGGTGQASAINEDGTLNGPANPAPRGSIVTIFGTGQGTATTYAVRAGGKPAAVLYSGPAPVVPSAFQINFQLPELTEGAEVPLVVEVGGSVSQAGVTLAVK